VARVHQNGGKRGIGDGVALGRREKRHQRCGMAAAGGAREQAAQACGVIARRIIIIGGVGRQRWRRQQTA